MIADTAADKVRRWLVGIRTGRFVRHHRSTVFEIGRRRDSTFAGSPASSGCSSEQIHARRKRVSSVMTTVMRMLFLVVSAASAKSGKGLVRMNWAVVATSSAVPVAYSVLLTSATTKQEENECGEGKECDYASSRAACNSTDIALARCRTASRSVAVKKTSEVKEQKGRQQT